jgi:hypothetical protein
MAMTAPRHGAKWMMMQQHKQRHNRIVSERRIQTQPQQALVVEKGRTMLQIIVVQIQAAHRALLLLRAVLGQALVVQITLLLPPHPVTAMHRHVNRRSRKMDQTKVGYSGRHVRNGAIPKGDANSFNGRAKIQLLCILKTREAMLLLLLRLLSILVVIVLQSN